MPSQLASSRAGSCSTQLSWSTPATQLVTPVAAHAPTPQLVDAATNPSSMEPSQSLSRPSQVTSAAPGVPGSQLSVSCPSSQLVAPTDPQAPSPHCVASATYSSSTKPSQSSSRPSQVVSDASP